RATLRFRYNLGGQLAHLRDVEDVRRLAVDGAHFLGSRLRAARPLLKDPIAAFSASWLARTFGMATVVVVRHPGAFASSLKRLHRGRGRSCTVRDPAVQQRDRDDLEDAAVHGGTGQAAIAGRGAGARVLPGVGALRRDGRLVVVAVVAVYLGAVAVGRTVF